MQGLCTAKADVGRSDTGPGDHRARYAGSAVATCPQEGSVLSTELIDFGSVLIPLKTRTDLMVLTPELCAVETIRVIKTR